MDDVVLVGVDGGATKVLVHTVEILTNPLRFTAEQPLIEVNYESSRHFQPSFKPRSLKYQLQELRAKRVSQAKDEIRQEKAIIESFVKAITTLVKEDHCCELVIGVGLPGLKTPNKRGISAMANGPRMPHFLTNLQKALKSAGFKHVNRIDAIGSDADYCGLGERWGDEGAIREVENAYYIGIGTGIADALILDGELLPFDGVAKWMAKTWEMMATEDETYEDIISAQGIQQRYAALTGTTLDELNARQVYPWQIFESALIRDEKCRQIAEQTVDALAELLFYRIYTLAKGSPELRLVDPQRKLELEHPHLGKCLERIVIGQRLGDIWQFRDFEPVFRDPVEIKLGRKLHESDLPADIKAEYLTKTNRLRDDLIVHSDLRHAPALGAAVDAYLAWIK